MVSFYFSLLLREMTWRCRSTTLVAASLYIEFEASITCLVGVASSLSRDLIGETDLFTTLLGDTTEFGTVPAAVCGRVRT